MTDLNEWRLAYPGKEFDFGTLSSDYPLAVQLEMSDTEPQGADYAHSSSDGMVFGADRLGGQTLTFTMKTIPGFADSLPIPNVKEWNFEEKGLENWEEQGGSTLVLDDAQVHGGVQAAKVTGGTSARVKVETLTELNTEYIATVWVYVTAADTSDALVWVGGPGVLAGTGGNFTSPVRDEWVQIAAPFTTAGAVDTAQIQVASGSADRWFDDVVLSLANPPVPTPWENALNLLSRLKSAWRADAVRRTPGAYATLTNLARGRQVHGRPRKIGAKLPMLRKGVVEVVAEFDVNDPNFYSQTEKTATITPIPPVAGGFTSPLIPPISTTVTSNETGLIENEGDLDAWPVVEFHGPGRAFSVELLDINGDTIWVITVPDQITYDQVLTVDTRPWQRSSTINGLPANGYIRGTQLEQCTIPVGEYELRFKVSDSSGTAFAVVAWRDAYASL